MKRKHNLDTRWLDIQEAQRQAHRERQRQEKDYIAKQKKEQEALARSPFAIANIRQTPERCLEAVEVCGLVLDCIKEQTLELCLTAVEQDAYAIIYVRDKEIQEAIRHLHRLRDNALPAEDPLSRMELNMRRSLYKQRYPTDDELDLEFFNHIRAMRRRI